MPPPQLQTLLERFVSGLDLGVQRLLDCVDGLDLGRFWTFVRGSGIRASVDDGLTS